MVRMSNSLIGVLNLLSLIISIPVLGGALWLRLDSSTECQKLIELPLLVLGGFLFSVSLLGLIVSCCRVSFLLRITCSSPFLLILGLFVFTVFSIVMTNKGVGKAVAGIGYKEYKLGGYSNWLPKHVVDGSDWVEIKSCLIDAGVYQSLGNDANQQAAHFYQKNLSPIQI